MTAMKQPTKIALLYIKILLFVNKLFVISLKIRGLQSGKGTRIGKIHCDWPNKINIGTDCEIQDDVDFRLWQPFNDSSYIKMGENVFIGHACEFVCNTKIIIGNNVMLAPRVSIYAENHVFDNPDILIRDQGVAYQTVIIEDDCWIAANSIILAGVTIGKGSVVAAGSVVTENVAPYSVVAGVPAKFIKNRN